MIGDFHNQRIGLGFVERVTGTGEGVGALRTLHLATEYGGGTVIERQVARDDAGFYYAYELDDSGPLPFEDYRGSVHVVGTAKDRSQVIWTNRYSAPADLAPTLRAQSLAILAVIENNTKALFDRPAM